MNFSQILFRSFTSVPMTLTADVVTLKIIFSKCNFFELGCFAIDGLSLPTCIMATNCCSFSTVSVPDCKLVSTDAEKKYRHLFCSNSKRSLYSAGLMSGVALLSKWIIPKLKLKSKYVKRYRRCDLWHHIFTKEPPEVKLHQTQNVHWSMIRNHKIGCFEISAEKHLDPITLFGTRWMKEVTTNLSNDRVDMIHAYPYDAWQESFEGRPRLLDNDLKNLKKSANKV